MGCFSTSIVPRITRVWRPRVSSSGSPRSQERRCRTRPIEVGPSSGGIEQVGVDVAAVGVGRGRAAPRPPAPCQARGDKRDRLAGASAAARPRCPMSRRMLPRFINTAARCWSSRGSSSEELSSRACAIEIAQCLGELLEVPLDIATVQDAPGASPCLPGSGPRGLAEYRNGFVERLLREHHLVRLAEQGGAGHQERGEVNGATPPRRRGGRAVPSRMPGGPRPCTTPQGCNGTSSE